LSSTVSSSGVTGIRFILLILPLSKYLFAKHGWLVVYEEEEKYYLLREGLSAAHSVIFF